MKLNIEIKGVNFINKGAELMLFAIKDQLNLQYPNARVCLGMRSASMRRITSNGFYVIPHYFSKYVLINTIIDLIFFFIPKKLSKKLKFVKSSEIDVVLDASGFAYSEQWGPEGVEVMARYYGQVIKREGTVILLPQALGPFNSKRVQKAVTQMFSNSTYVFARDASSYEYVKDFIDSSKLEMGPDFTNLLQVPSLEEKYENYNNQVCIIPNYRMIDKGVGEEYVLFLKNIIEYLNMKNEHFYFLIHETGKDAEIISILENLIKCKLQYIFVDDSIIIKQLIGKSKIVIGSRFHGLISALSQCVPSLISGWSHKYKELALAYNVQDYVIDDFSNSKDYLNKLEMLLGDKQIISEELKQISEQIKEDAKIVWKKVFSLIDE